VEIDSAELRVYPIGNTDADTDRILDGLRYIRDEHRRDS
jgi:hypothetical protein